MSFRIWCRWGEMPIDATEFDAAMIYAVSYASRNGVCVVLLNQDRVILAEIPPAIQSNMIIPFLFSGEGEGMFEPITN